MKKYLGFLADRMGSRGLVEFELVSLQYDWGEYSKVQFAVAKTLRTLVIRLGDGLLYRFLSGLVIGFFLGLGLGLRIGLELGLFIGLVNSLGLILGAFFELTGIWRAKKWYIPLRVFRNNIKKSPVTGLTSSLFFFKKWLAIEVNDSQPEIQTKDTIVWSATLLKRQIEIYLIGGLIGGGVLSLASRRFVESMVLGLVIGIFYGLIAGLITQLNNNNSYLKINSPYLRFNASIAALHFSILQHWHLRRLLRKKGLLPKKLVAFLQTTSTQNILESDGGSWRFRHRILQEYFGGHWREKSAVDSRQSAVE